MRCTCARRCPFDACLLQRVAIISLTYLAIVGWREACAGPIPALDANLKLWLDASDLNGNSISDNPSSGTSVGQWDDGSGLNNDAIQATGSLQPTYQSAGIGGKPVVRFNGSRAGAAQDYLDMAFASVAQPFTIFVVGRIDGNMPAGNPLSSTLSAADYFFDGTLSGNRIAMAINGSGANENEFFMYAGGAGAPATPFTRAQWLLPHVYMGQFDSSPSTDTRLFIDGVNKPLTGTLGGTSLTALRLGNRFSGDIGLKGDIAEILIYNKNLTDGERQSVEAYLNVKYSIPEPSSLTLIAVGAVLVIRRGRGRLASRNMESHSRLQCLCS